MTVSSATVAPVLGFAPATVRSQVTIPLSFPDGFTAAAEVLTFRGLADGKEHLLLAFGEWETALLHRRPRRSGAPGPPAQRMPDRGRVRQRALRLRTAVAGGC